jgi:hypothetical protein
MCQRHVRQWYYAGRPDLAAWQASAVPLPPPAELPTACRIGYCTLWAQGTSAFCMGHDNRWKGNGRPGVDEFAASCEDAGPGQEHIDLRRLPVGLRLEVQYVLQCRADEQAAKLPPRDVHPLVAVLAAAGVSSLLEQPEEWWAALDAPKSGRGWRAFILDARRRVEALAFGAGWDTEYPRDAWRLCNLGISQPEATITFAGIPQPWLRELAKRCTRWQLATGLSARRPAAEHNNSGKVRKTRSRVRFWERNGSGGRLSGAVTSGHRAWQDSPDVRKRAAAAVLPGGALSSHRGGQCPGAGRSVLYSCRLWRRVTGRYPHCPGADGGPGGYRHRRRSIWTTAVFA